MSSTLPPSPFSAEPLDEPLEPINLAQQAVVISQTERYIERAASLFKREFPLIPVYFNLSGRASGMYKVKGKERCIRYNPYIFALYFDQHLIDTVAHEVGHYIADSLYGLANIKPHGVEWREVMDKFGADASRTFNHSLKGVPLRRHRQFTYHCGCGDHQLGIRRHNKVSRGQVVYVCRRCQGELRCLPI